MYRSLSICLVLYDVLVKFILTGKNIVFTCIIFSALIKLLPLMFTFTIFLPCCSFFDVLQLTINGAAGVINHWRVAQIL